MKSEGDPADNLCRNELADMAKTIEREGKLRVNGDISLHVLEIMHGIRRSSKQGQHTKMESTGEGDFVIER